MKAVLSTLPLIAAVALAQERCDAPYPNTYCNTTEILAFEGYDCKPYHVFIVRGSDEPYPGRQGNLTSKICSRIGSNECSYENIQYPAKSTAWGKDEWCKSAAKGAQSGLAQFSGYSQKCPDSKLILLGFSQGASVAQDILGGGGGPVFECEQATNAALDSSIGDKVVAAVTFGAVARSRDQNFTIGEGRPYDGTRARTTEQMKALSKYSDRLRDYCHFGDPICAVGSTPQDVGAHLDYFLKHNEEVASWVAEKAKAKPEKVSHDTSTSTETRKASTSAHTTSSTTANPLPPSSIIAKSAAMPTTTPELITPTTRPATDTSKAASAKSGSESGTANTGAASSLMPFTGCASFVAVMAVAMAFVL